LGCSASSISTYAPGYIAAQILGEAPVDHDGLAERADEHVGGLEIAVDDALAVGVRDRVGHGDHVRQEGQALARRWGVADDVVERAARDELHRVERLARRPAPDVVDGDDGRVLEARGDRRLAHEARVRGAALAEDLLERDGAADPQIAHLEDAAEAAARELAHDVVARRIDGRQPHGVDIAGAGAGIGAWAWAW
jgi:hypothetical protein